MFVPFRLLGECDSPFNFDDGFAHFGDNGLVAHDDGVFAGAQVKHVGITGVMLIDLAPVDDDLALEFFARHGVDELLELGPGETSSGLGAFASGVALIDSFHVFVASVRKFIRQLKAKMVSNKHTKRVMIAIQPPWVLQNGWGAKVGFGARGPQKINTSSAAMASRT
jgi:hypothetical protein